MGRQHVDVDDMTPQDLDQLSSLIADALQVVDQGQNTGLTRDRPGPRDLEGELREEQQEDEEEDVGKEQRVRDEEEEEEKKVESAPTVKAQESAPMAQAELQGRYWFPLLFTVKILTTN